MVWSLRTNITVFLMLMLEFTKYMLPPAQSCSLNILIISFPSFLFSKHVAVRREIKILEKIVSFLFSFKEREGEKGWIHKKESIFSPNKTI